MLPSTFSNLPRKEKAFVIASIQIRVEKEAKEQKKIEKQTKKKR